MVWNFAALDHSAPVSSPVLADLILVLRGIKEPGSKIQNFIISKRPTHAVCKPIAVLVLTIIKDSRPDKYSSLGVTKTEFSLAAHGKHEDRIQFGHVPVERQVATGAGRNDQFALAVFHRPADEWAGFQYIEGGNDGLDPVNRSLRYVLEQKIEDPVKIATQSFGKNYLRHRRAFGALAVLPLARTWRYARMSCHGIPTPEAIISVKRASASS